MSTCCITGVGREEWEGIFAVADDNDNQPAVCIWLAYLDQPLWGAFTTGSTLIFLSACSFPHFPEAVSHKQMGIVILE